jgi:hypothetical protein
MRVERICRRWGGMGTPPPHVSVAMSRSHSRETEPSSDWIEFELTDVDEARRVHDTLPEGVGKLAELAPDYWERRRRKALPMDRALAGFTIDWLLSLPAGLRPRSLCDRYPRAANAIAAAADGADRFAVLNELLSDRRGNRHGFPPEIRQELVALRDAIAAAAVADAGPAEG